MLGDSHNEKLLQDLQTARQLPLIQPGYITR